MTWLDHITVGTPEQCWPWQGARTGTGYGHFAVNGKHTVAHRQVYEFCRGPIPHGFDLHHKCGVRHCTNPYHLEPLSKSEHNLTKWPPHCPAGHPYADPPTRDNRGKRKCLVCHRERERERRRGAKAARSK